MDCLIQTIKSPKEEWESLRLSRAAEYMRTHSFFKKIELAGASLEELIATGEIIQLDSYQKLSLHDKTFLLLEGSASLFDRSQQLRILEFFRGEPTINDLQVLANEKIPTFNRDLLNDPDIICKDKIQIKFNRALDPGSLYHGYSFVDITEVIAEEMAKDRETKNVKRWFLRAIAANKKLKKLRGVQRLRQNLRPTSEPGMVITRTKGLAIIWDSKIARPFLTKQLKEAVKKESGKIARYFPNISYFFIEQNLKSFVKYELVKRDVVYNYKATSDSFYLILHGKVELSHPESPDIKDNRESLFKKTPIKQEKRAFVHSKGQIFGDTEFARKEPRMFKAEVVSEDAIIIQIYRPLYYKMRESSDEFCRRFDLRVLNKLRIISKRLKSFKPILFRSMGDNKEDVSSFKAFSIVAKSKPKSKEIDFQLLKNKPANRADIEKIKSTIKSKSRIASCYLGNRDMGLMNMEFMIPKISVKNRQEKNKHLSKDYIKTSGSMMSILKEGTRYLQQDTLILTSKNISTFTSPSRACSSYICDSPEKKANKTRNAAKSSYSLKFFGTSIRNETPWQDLTRPATPTRPATTSSNNQSVVKNKRKSVPRNIALGYFKHKQSLVKEVKDYEEKRTAKQLRLKQRCSVEALTINN